MHVSPSRKTAIFLTSGNKLRWLLVSLVMLGLSDYARRFVRASEKEKTDREPVVTECETTFDGAVISANAIRPAMNRFSIRNL